MRAIPDALKEKLESGATTLCRCWVLRRRDGIVQGFTDHDEDVALADAICRAGSGLDASEATAQFGLAVTATEISGALSADSLNEDDLAAGRYDAAAIDTYIVDWSEPALHVLMQRGTLGEVRREGAAFIAEIRGLTDRLSQESGRLYTATCTADLGDRRCNVDLDDPRFCASGAVTTLRGTSAFGASGLDSFAEGWFTAGRLVWTSGDNAGQAVEIKQHRRAESDGILELWQAMPAALNAGDTFLVTAGCDKRFSTCRDRFDNVANFRGFPHIPGNDFVVSYAVDGEPGHNGASLQSR
jgi:uncharacterized phage protein (TIGR02218 family)